MVDRAIWQAELDTPWGREKAHTRQGDEIAAARRRLPMVESPSTIPLVGAHGPAPLLSVFEALVLGRARRTVLAFDENRPRNAVTQVSHGFVMRNGAKPDEFRAFAQRENRRH